MTSLLFEISKFRKEFGLYRILYCFSNLFKKYEQYLEKLQIGSTCIHRFSTVKVRIFKELIARKFIIFSKLIARKFIFMVNCKGCFLGLQAWQLQDVIDKREQLGETVDVRFSVWHFSQL